MTILDITDRCNLKCTYCCRGVQRGKISELKNDDIIDFAKQIISARGTFFVLQGGEPLLKKNVLDLLHRLKSLKPTVPGHYRALMQSLIAKRLSGQPMKVAYMKNLIAQGLPLFCLTTNGMMYTEAIASALYESGFSLEVSLDAPTKEINAETRIGIDFDKVVENIKRYAEKLPVEISCTIAEHNTNVLPEMIPFAKRLGCLCLKFSPVIMIGDRKKPDTLWSDAYLDALDKAIDQYATELDNLFIKVKLYPHFLKSEKGRSVYAKLQQTQNVLIELHECTACQQVKTVYIDPHLNVYPCASMKNEKSLIIGNLKNNTLKEIWASDQKKCITKTVKAYSKLKTERDLACTAVTYSTLHHLNEDNNDNS